LDNKDYYHSYKDLKKDLEDARDSAPTIVKEENQKLKMLSAGAGECLHCFLSF